MVTWVEQKLCTQASEQPSQSPSLAGNKPDLAQAFESKKGMRKNVI